MNYKTFLLLSAVLLLAGCAPSGEPKERHTFEISNGHFLYDGQPTLIHSGEMHYSRVPAPYWRHRMQMLRAMGLNAVAVYVFWNYHEVAPGLWDWETDEHNIRKFIQTAQEEGLMVILRPGPYSCGEWEYGGYPWWLQQEEGLVVRANNRQFLDHCRAYIHQLAEQVRDLQVTHGGPIVMVQAENEFGSYVAQRTDIPLDEHKRYSAAIRQILLDEGFDVPLFTSDGAWLFEGGAIEGALPTANGEGDVDNLKKVVDQYHGGEGPYMVAEFYPGWLDHWNEPFQRISADGIVSQTRKYLENDISFNYYMAHGGTNFAFWAGANYNTDTNIQPDITSYDYDAPVSEAGWATDKYMALRDLLRQHVDYDVPAVPEPIPVIAVSDILLGKTVDVISMLDETEAVENDEPMTFEDLGQGFGYVLYRRHFNQPIKGMMRVPGLADFATVYVDGKRVGLLNRLSDLDSLEVDLPFNSTLDILVENCGRINYGARITENHKGITQLITIDGKRVSGQWKMYRLPLTTQPALADLPSDYQTGRPVFYGGTFQLDKAGDTFLDMHEWGKGIVYVNGHHLGRYWNVGPQQTLYVPGCWLKEGNNDIVVFEQLNDRRQYALSTVKEPVLDQLVSPSERHETLEDIIDRQAAEIAGLKAQVEALRQQLATKAGVQP